MPESKKQLVVKITRRFIISRRLESPKKKKQKQSVNKILIINESISSILYLIMMIEIIAEIDDAKINFTVRTFRAHIFELNNKTR